MVLLEEARRQLEEELYLYLGSMQPTAPATLPLRRHVGSAVATMAASNVVDTAAEPAARLVPVRPPKGDGAGGGSQRTFHGVSAKRAPNVKQSRTRLNELTKRLQCAILMTAQVSSVDDDADAVVSVTRKGADKGFATTLPAISTIPSAAAAPPRRGSAGARRGAADSASRAESLSPSPGPHHFLDTHSSGVLSARDLGQTASTMNTVLTTRSTRSNTGIHKASANLRRLSASLVFIQDCLRYATTLAEAGLGNDAQSFFLQPIAHDIASHEQLLPRCVEQQKQQQQQPADAHLPQNSSGALPGSTEATSASSRTARRLRHSVAGGRGREDRKRVSVVDKAGNSGSGIRAPGEDGNVDDGIPLSDSIDVFAPDVPMPLVLLVHRCVVHYHALTLYIRFGELMLSDVYGDATGLSTALEACTCVEQLVELQQRVLRTPPFNAASILKREAARLKEDVGPATDARPKTLNAILVAGYRLVDLLEVPPRESPSSPDSADNAPMNVGEGGPHVYAVEDTAAPVLFAMRQYVANMGQRLLDYLSSAMAATAAASPSPSETYGQDVASSVTRRLTEALSTSLSMSELHLSNTHSSAPALASIANSPTSGGEKTCFPLATVEYLPWRLSEYALLQSCFVHLQEDPSWASAALGVAQRALYQVLQLMELEFLDPVPPPASSLYLLEMAVQQCAANLLVSMWRAGMSQDGIFSSTQLSLAAEMSAKVSAQESAVDLVSGSTGAPATANSAMAAINAVVQQTVMHFLSLQGSTMTSPKRSALQRNHSFAPPASRVTGTRVLIILWTCMAQVQQQCALLGGKWEAAEALRSAATSDVQYDDGSTLGDTAGDGTKVGSFRSMSNSGSKLPRTASFAEKSPRKGKGGSSSGSAAGSGKRKPEKAAEESAELAGESSGRGASVPFLPKNIAHSHPSVAVAAARFPHVALDVILQLVTSIEAAGGVPRSTGRIDGTNDNGAYESGGSPLSERRQSLSKRTSSVGVKDSAERKSIKGPGSQASTMASFSEVGLSMSAGTCAPAPLAGLHTHPSHAVFRGCVEALEVLLHGAAVAATEIPPAGSETPASTSMSSTFCGGGTQLSILTHAAVLRDVGKSLHLDECVEVLATHGLGDSCTVADSMSTLTDSTNTNVSKILKAVALDMSLAPVTDRSTPMVLTQRCFLYNAADMRCLSRNLTWETLFLSSSLMPPGTAALLSTRGALDVVDVAVQRLLTAFRTLAMASSQPVITVRVGVALESWLCTQLYPMVAANKPAATTVTGSSTKPSLSSPSSAAPSTRLLAIEIGVRCIELLRVLVLTVMLQSRQHRLVNDEGALAVTLRAFSTMENTLSNSDGLAVSINSLPLAEKPTEEHAKYMRLLALSQVGLRLSQHQWRCACGGGGGGRGRRAGEASLHEFTESVNPCGAESGMVSFLNTIDDGGGGGASLLAPTTPHSLRLYSAPAALLDKVTTSLRVHASPLPLPSSAASTGEDLWSADVAATAAGGLNTPMGVTVSLLKPVVLEVASFLLRCGGELRSQWQRHRAHRQVRKGAATEDDAPKTAQSTLTTEPASLSIGERDAEEEATYATVVLYVLASVWRSGASGCRRGMQLADSRCVASLVRSVESGFLGLIPALPSSSAAPAEEPGTSIPLAQLARLIRHGVTARRLADRVRGHLQHRVESLLARTEAVAGVPRRHVVYGTDAPAQVCPAVKTRVKDAPAEAKPPSNHGQLTVVRDALTELTSLWVTVRWHLARLRAYQGAYGSHMMDLETLHGRHEKQEVYGRATEKELRILRTLEQATPVLPISAKDEELRLRNWVAEQRQRLSAQSQSRMTAPMCTSLLLLDALVCTALVPLNTANPSAQQKLLDEAIRYMRQAEEDVDAKKQGKRHPGAHVALLKSRSSTATEARVLYTPLLLWCYISEAANVYGTREQADHVRAVLDSQVLQERSDNLSSSHNDGIATVVTMSFIQRLMLQPKWTALQASSTTTLLAYCRALSSMAAAATSKGAFGSDALGTLQGVYRLVLALRIQGMSSASEMYNCGAGDSRKRGGAPPTGKSETPASPPAVSAFISLPLAVDTAQQLVSALSNYFSCSNGHNESRRTPPTAAAPLLLPPLVALCEVLLALFPSSPQWADAAVQLLAVRVLTIFKDQLRYLVSSTVAALGAAGCSPFMADPLLRLLWVTVVHVWNSIFCSPNVRQHRFRLAAVQETLWTRRVLDGHQSLMMEQQRKTQLAEATASADTGPKGGGGGKSGRHGRSSRGASSEASASAHADSFTPESSRPHLECPGLAYLALEDTMDDGARGQRGHEVKGDAPDGSNFPGGSSVTPSLPAAAATGAADSLNRRTVSELSTISMHTSVPAELVELLEEVLFHMPALWPLIFSVGMDGGATADADAGTEGVVASTSLEAVGTMTSTQQHKKSREGAEEAEQSPQQPLLNSPADFMRCASQDAARVLRSQTTASMMDVPLPTSTSPSKQSSLQRLYGLPAVYSDVTSALRQYSAMVKRFAGSGSSAAAGSGGISGTRGIGGSRGHVGGSAGGGGGGGAVSSILLDTLSKYKDDPAYAKLAVHVVQEMLTMCSDAEDNVSHGTGGGGGATSSILSTNSATAAAAAARKRHMVSSNAVADLGLVPITTRSTSVAAAGMIIADARQIIDAVRGQVTQNRLSISSFLNTMNREMQAWLTCGGYTHSSSALQPAAVGGAGEGALSAAALAGKRDAGKAAGGKKKKGASRGAARRGKAGKSGGQESDDDDADAEARDAVNGTPAYTTVTRLWSPVEEQSLKLLTCAIAWWRRRRAARTLLHRYTQYNMAFMAQLHLYEATLLHMGAVAQHTAAAHERQMRGVLGLVNGQVKGEVDLRGNAIPEKKTSASSQAASSASAANTQAGPTGSNGVEKQQSSGSGSGTTAEALEGLSQITVELLRHCARAALLFEYLWLPLRVHTAVQLAVQHLQQLRVTLPQEKGLSASSPASLTALVRQLLAAPLFCMAAVQHGYWDARRDVHAGILQPSVMKVGADVSWHRRFRFHQNVPSLFSSATLCGQHEELQSTQEARIRAQRLRQHKQLQLRMCIEAEAATRSEAERDEVKAKVHILHKAQELLPELRQNTATKAIVLEAADLLRFSPGDCSDRLSRSGSVQRRMNALQSISVPNREAVHAAALFATTTIQYFTFEGVPRCCDAAAAVGAASATATMGSQRGSGQKVAGGADTSDSSGAGGTKRRAVIEAANYGRGMRESTLVEQVICLGSIFAPLQPMRWESAYRIAQDLTAGRYAGELLPLIINVEKIVRGKPLPETEEAYHQAMRNVPEGLKLLRAARAACAQLSVSEMQAFHTHPKQHGQLLPFPASGASTSSQAVLARGAITRETRSSFRSMIQQYERVATSLRRARLLQPLGECLYEKGNLYCALSRLDEAAKCWTDALDCFLGTPNALEDWHRHRVMPPAPPSGPRRLEDLLWITAALSALTNHAFLTDTPRATAASLLCALLVHQHWQLPGVVSSVSAFDNESHPNTAADRPPPLPLAQYGLLDVHYLSAPLSSALRPNVVGMRQQRAPTGLPGALADVTRDLISAAQRLLVNSPYACYSGEAAVLAAFCDFVATVVLQSVELTVEARLVRAAAAAHLGTFSLAMRHIYSLCVGAGLPQPMSALLEVGESLPGFYSLGCAAAQPVGVTTTALAFLSPASPQPSNSATVPFLFYKDDENPSSLHNTAAVRTFLAACLPGFPLDSAVKLSGVPGSKEGDIFSRLPLTTGVLASAALEERYGACLTRRLLLGIAEMFVRLGTHDPAFLLLAGSSLTTLASAISPPLMPSNSSAAANLAGSTNNSPQSRSLSSVTTVSVRSASSGGRSSPPMPSSAAATARSDRSTNACVEACCYAGVLLQSLASADVCWVLTGQPAPSSVSEGGSSPARSLSNPGAATGSSSHAPKTRGGASAQGAAAAVTSVPSEGKQVSTITDRSSEKAPGSPCAAWLGTLGAIRQQALLLMAQLLTAQGEYSAGVHWLTASIVELSEARQSAVSLVPVSSDVISTTAHATSRSRVAQPSGAPAAAPAPKPLAPSPPSLKGLGFQDSDQALARFLFGFHYWVCVWLLICRCYSHLRRYPQLEEAARTQGLHLCTTFGVEGVKKCDNDDVDSKGGSSTFRDASYWTAFQLYRIYALTQLGRMREAAEIVAALELSHRAAAPTSSAGVVTADRPSMALSEDRCITLSALRWWRAHQGEPCESILSRDDIIELTRLATLKHGVLPWTPLTCVPSPSPSSAAVSESMAFQRRHYTLVSPCAYSILPSVVLSRFALTAKLWGLHDAMNRYAWMQLQQHQQLASSMLATPPYPSNKTEANSSKGPQGSHASLPRFTKPHHKGAIQNTIHEPALAVSTFGAPAPAISGAAASLVQAIEAVSPQYDTAVHSSCWFESQLWVAQLRVREVCTHLVRAARAGEDVGRAESGISDTPMDRNDSAPVAAQTELSPILSSREDVLRALPPLVRDVCDDLLRVLNCCVELPVQRHSYVRTILLDLARVVSTYARFLRARRHDTPVIQGIHPMLADTRSETGLVSQLDAIASACVLLAGLVSDMERRVRTGADSLRGYATYSRVAAAAASLSEANTGGQGQTPWPELLWAALQRTQDTVGRLTPSTQNSNPDGSGIAASADVVSHPFYSNMSAQQQMQLLSPGTGTAPLGSSTGTEPDRGSSGGRIHKNAAKGSSPSTPSGAPSNVNDTQASQLSVPMMALTYAMLCDEAAAAQVLTPVTDVLEHDVARQLLTRHLQRLSTPVNCTYLCYRDDERQALLESLGAMLAQQQVPQPQSSRRGGGGSASHSRRAGPASSASLAHAATAGGGSGVGNAALGVRMTEVDVWKALAPPLLLTQVPATFFSVLGADVLGAPLYNSVAASAALCVVGGTGAVGGAATTTGRGTTDASSTLRVRSPSLRGSVQESRWQLCLSVSPLQDAEVATAPPALAPSTVASSLENCALLPPSSVLTAAAASGENGGVGVTGAALSSSPSIPATSSSRGRGSSRQPNLGGSSNTSSIHGGRVSGQVSLLASMVAGGSDRGGGGSGGAWWPPIIAGAVNATREILVPSTNWAYLDLIQHRQQQQLQRQHRMSKLDSDGAVKGPPSPSLALPSAHVARNTRKASRKESVISPSANVAVLGGGGNGGGVLGVASHKNDSVALACEPAPLRWSCVSFEVSGSTLRILRRHLRAVRACMRRIEVEESLGTRPSEAAAFHKSRRLSDVSSRRTEDTASGSAGVVSPTANTVETHAPRKKDDHSAILSPVAAGANIADTDAASDHAAVARQALAAAVAQAQTALRSRVLAGGGGTGGVAAGINTMPPSLQQGSAADGSARTGVSGNHPGGLSSTGTATVPGVTPATSPAASSGRKAANKGNGAGRGPLHGSTNSGAGGTDGLNARAYVTHDDLADAARSQRVIERRQKLRQLEEELDEAKSSLLMELLEAIVSAAYESSLYASSEGTILDEARIEADVQRLLPRCALSSDVIGFLEEWMGAHDVVNIYGRAVHHETNGSDDRDDNADGDDSCSGRSRATSIRFYNAGLHEWMQRISRYIVEQQQQQQQP